ncbi:hypothetical protein Maq22A_1p35420 (plasmid) [Methylobacterium aquaticum]|uniref:Uncharacterized protein n=1 Tax=Methylobacterium aquaticum TaxID=270351 RepID=A0A0C6FQJ0_9HYPH|nr:hypothetical protein Maq22A_1p35420 [Methylobacterium aquaticum]
MRPLPRVEGVPRRALPPLDGARESDAGPISGAARKTTNGTIGARAPLRRLGALTARPGRRLSPGPDAAEASGQAFLRDPDRAYRRGPHPTHLSSRRVGCLA